MKKKKRRERKKNNLPIRIWTCNISLSKTSL